MSLICASFISQFFHPVGGGGYGVKGRLVIKASWEYNFITVHENLVQHPSNNISIKPISRQRKFEAVSVKYSYVHQLITQFYLLKKCYIMHIWKMIIYLVEGS